jgi:hypothetical protein
MHRCGQAHEFFNRFNSLLESFCRSNCVDLRDKVYGLLGLLGDRAYENSDYENGLQQVFDAAVCFG